jgi:hypothetical protein
VLTQSFFFQSGFDIFVRLNVCDFAQHLFVISVTDGVNALAIVGEHRVATSRTVTVLTAPIRLRRSATPIKARRKTESRGEHQRFAGTLIPS